MAQHLKHWRTRRDIDDILWIRYQGPHDDTNLLTQAGIDELIRLIDELSDDDSYSGLVFLPDPQRGFIAGTDREVLEAVQASEAPLPHIQALQARLQKLAQLSIPTVAAIHGTCFSGGLEIALACRYRVATDAAETRLGFPDISALELHPCWGGTVRLPQLIGEARGLPMLIDAEVIDTVEARRIGLVDQRVPSHQLRTAARRLVLRQPRSQQQAGIAAQVSKLALFRQGLLRRLRLNAAQQYDPQHNPAPFAILDLEEAASGDIGARLQAEAESFVKLALSDTTRNLLRLDRHKQRLEALGQIGKAEGIRHVHVVGAGTMGSAIAAWCALKGLKVTLQDAVPRHIAAAIRHAVPHFQAQLGAEPLVAAALDRLQPDPSGYGLVQADVVLEAVTEEVEVKKTLLRNLEPHIKPDAIIGSNTSSIPLETLAESLDNPSRLVGIHFFNPLVQRPLVEVAAGKQTSRATLNKARGFVGLIDRLPLPVAGNPGLLINRVINAYLLEGMTMADEGLAPTLIDQSARGFGMALGPLELADRIGLDVCLQVARSLAEHGGGEVPDTLAIHVAAGRLGSKSGRGFYEYKQKRAVKLAPDPDHTSRDDITDRPIYRLLNEAVRCLREGIVEDADLLDVGLTLSTGFPGFRGGPIHYVCQRGADASAHRLGELASYYGERFEPDEGWKTLCG
ncbi:hypothetical protein CAI21_03555 [Alkalilimnicola ehrlichii]|uniref:Uncharacterized protein n=1 Tax=Alkalilimnicola ehrlichii TaxID=351052 RepID=A0A3E0X0Q9_9GAMM|nr:3-hydroxyacyl-CoA dehydrogenase NAD-binding domain-containing protein [Alkalilimnicola ehrlichii]RFA31053.1 hypothetical protein CAI21_03555 [Alkalilimnicola ehrlichii]RFA39010.1 hypothetical protein CAL65_03710 [Alkalilimnicola ehrlichii]